MSNNLANISNQNQRVESLYFNTTQKKAIDRMRFSRFGYFKIITVCKYYYSLLVTFANRPYFGFIVIVTAGTIFCPGSNSK
jgi:hypothetical protein